MPSAGSAGILRCAGAKKQRARPGELTRAAHQAASARKAAAAGGDGLTSILKRRAAAAELDAVLSPLRFASGSPAMRQGISSALPLSPLPFSLPTTPLRVRFAGGGSGRAGASAAGAARSRKGAQPTKRGGGSASGGQTGAEAAAPAAVVIDLMPTAMAQQIAPFADAELPRRPLSHRPLPALCHAGAAAAAASAPHAPEAGQLAAGVARPAGMLTAAALRVQLQQRQPPQAPDLATAGPGGYFEAGAGGPRLEGPRSALQRLKTLQVGHLRTGADAGQPAAGFPAGFAAAASSEASAAALEALALPMLPEPLPAPAAAMPCAAAASVEQERKQTSGSTLQARCYARGPLFEHVMKHCETLC